MTTIITIAALWLIASVPLGVFIGRMIGRAK